MSLFTKTCRTYCTSNNVILKQLFSNIQLNTATASQLPFYILKKEKEIEVPRIGCNPVKRLDKELTRPIKQLLIIDSNNDNKKNCFEFMTQIQNLKLSLDINSVFLNNNNNNTATTNNNSIIHSIIDELPRVPILIGNDSASSDKIIEFLEKESNPIFSFVILNSPNKEIKKFRNLSDVYLVSNNSNNNSSNNNTEQLNIIKDKLQDEQHN